MKQEVADTWRSHNVNAIISSDNNKNENKNKNDNEKENNEKYEKEMLDDDFLGGILQKVKTEVYDNDNLSLKNYDSLNKSNSSINKPKKHQKNQKSNNSDNINRSPLHSKQVEESFSA